MGWWIRIKHKNAIPSEDQSDEAIAEFNATYNSSRFKDLILKDGTTKRLLYAPDLNGKEGRVVARIAYETLDTLAEYHDLRSLMIEGSSHPRDLPHIESDPSPYTEEVMRKHYVRAVYNDFLWYGLCYPDDVFHII
jgi:hypothetical protein